MPGGASLFTRVLRGVAQAGLRHVIVGIPTLQLNAATKAGVPRFIPSDYSIDFTKLPPGENRNLDLRREFHQCIYKTSIRATTIFNGAFAEMQTGQMPLILSKRKRVLYWGDADQRMDFTTMDDTAAFTARAVAPGEIELHPAWQGMQYMRNMCDGRAKLQPLDNDRYPNVRWATVRDVLSKSRIQTGDPP